MFNESKTRVKYYLDTFNQVGSTDNGLYRLAYTKEEQLVHQRFKKEAENLGMIVNVDAAGNTIARRTGKSNELPAVAVGSHLDTVYNGGKYDGTVGVVAGLEIVARLNEQDIKTDAPIEVIAFAGEESSRFGLATIGSKAMSGSVKIDKAGTLKDNDGITLQESLENFNLSLEEINKAKRCQKDLKCFLEVHIEQGLELEIAEKPIGIVTGIAAPTRLKIHVLGQANHSGTTSMYRRKDALTAASELILYLEKLGVQEAENGTVATIGVCSVDAGSMNTIPGEVTLYGDIRSTDYESKVRVFEALKEYSIEIMQKRSLDIEIELLTDEQPIPLSEKIQNYLQKACDENGVASLRMASGAGHDAMNMAKLWPTGLLFIPCRDGVSHHPDEYASMESVIKGIDTLTSTVISLAHESEEMSFDEAVSFTNIK